jgi:hypothetical protein
MSASDTARQLVDKVTAIEYLAARGDTLEALRALNTARDVLVDLATALVEAGVHDGLTQRAMADAMGVPASALRGARRELAHGH